MPYADPNQKREYGKKWYRENKEKVSEYNKSYREENREATVQYRKENYSKVLKSRAKRMGLPFDLDNEDIIQPEICPILGILLSNNNRRLGADSPSVDRIIPSKGYTKGNIQVISHKANVMKSNATPEELRMFAKWVLKTFPEEPDVQA